MDERLPKGIRIHNRKEKALARKEKRSPELLTKSSNFRETSRVVRSPEPIIFSPIYFQPTIVNAPEQTSSRKLLLKNRKRIPDIDELISSGSNLAMKYGTVGKMEPSHEYLSDKKAVEILQNLEMGIWSGEVTSNSQISFAVKKLGHKMGPMGSASTEIDLAAFHVLEAIKENASNIQN